MNPTDRPLRSPSRPGPRRSLGKSGLILGALLVVLICTAVGASEHRPWVALGGDMAAVGLAFASKLLKKRERPAEPPRNRD